MVDADAFNGTYTKNPFNFKNYDITTMGLTVNGENLPGKPLQLKFGADSNYISAFQTLYAGTHKIFENQGNGITREEYANGYTLFVFDLTPDLCIGDSIIGRALRYIYVEQKNFASPFIGHVWTIYIILCFTSM